MKMARQGTDTFSTPRKMARQTNRGVKRYKKEKEGGKFKIEEVPTD